jgi:hypothetical protein
MTSKPPKNVPFHVFHIRYLVITSMIYMPVTKLAPITVAAQSKA